MILCKCMRMDCPNIHFADLGDDGSVAERTSDGTLPLRPIAVPDDASSLTGIAEVVMLKVGDSEPTVIGWLTDPQCLPDLLQEVVLELRTIQKERRDE